MIDLIPARPEMAHMLTPQPAQIATGQVMSPEEVAHAIRQGVALAATDGARVLAIGGVAELWSERGIVWGVLDQSIGRAMVPIHRAVRRALEVSPLRRIEAHVAAEHPEGHRWIELLGFEREGLMRAFWQGHDYVLYSRVR